MGRIFESDADKHDFRQDPEPDGKSAPDTRSGTDGHLGFPVTVISFRMTRPDFHQPVENGEQSAVNMSGELKIDLTLCGMLDHFRLVGKQNDR